MALKYRASSAACYATLRYDTAQCEVRDAEGCLALHVALKALTTSSSASTTMCGPTPELLQSILESFPAAAAEKMNGISSSLCGEKEAGLLGSTKTDGLASV